MAGTASQPRTPDTVMPLSPRETDSISDTDQSLRASLSGRESGPCLDELGIWQTEKTHLETWVTQAVCGLAFECGWWVWVCFRPHAINKRCWWCACAPIYRLSRRSDCPKHSIGSRSSSSSTLKRCLVERMLSGMTICSCRLSWLTARMSAMNTCRERGL